MEYAISYIKLVQLPIIECGGKGVPLSEAMLFLHGADI